MNEKIKGGEEIVETY